MQQAAEAAANEQAEKVAKADVRKDEPAKPAERSAAPEAAQSLSAQGLENADKTKPGVLVRSTDSFKVLIECPLIVMFLFQLYPKYIQSNIQVGVPWRPRLFVPP